MNVATDKKVTKKFFTKYLTLRQTFDPLLLPPTPAADPI
jgi:hypothetical protein